MNQKSIQQLLVYVMIHSFPTMLLSEFTGPKISVIEFGQNVLLYTFSWPKRLCPKRPWPKSPLPKCPTLHLQLAKTSWPKRT